MHHCSMVNAQEGVTGAMSTADVVYQLPKKMYISNDNNSWYRDGRGMSWIACKSNFYVASLMSHAAAVQPPEKGLTTVLFVFLCDSASESTCANSTYCLVRVPNTGTAEA